EDGIRHFHVTGVQTCALPISGVLIVPAAQSAPDLSLLNDRPAAVIQRFFPLPANVIIPHAGAIHSAVSATLPGPVPLLNQQSPRSEERRVGKNCDYICCTTSY